MAATTIRIKNMVSKCCIILLKERLIQHNIRFKNVAMGFIEVPYSQDAPEIAQIEKITRDIGMDVIKNKDEELVENIKTAVIELIHQLNNVNSIIRKSDYLVEKLGMSYQHLSKIFSQYNHTTLEKYIIRQKIERIKELIDQDEYSLSEISFMMDYSSVQYLSNQFKSITGMTVSEHKQQGAGSKRAIEEI